MDTEILTAFFMWCTIINGALLIFWTTICVLAPDRVYHLQNRFFPLRRDRYDVVIYAFLGVFKIIFIVFNLVPWLALLIVG